MVFDFATDAFKTVQSRRLMKVRVERARNGFNPAGDMLFLQGGEAVFQIWLSHHYQDIFGLKQHKPRAGFKNEELPTGIFPLTLAAAAEICDRVHGKKARKAVAKFVR